MGIWSKILKIVAASIVVLLLLMIAAFAVLNTKSFQNKMLKNATGMLSEKLQTEVDLDSVSIDLLTQDIRLFGLTIDDRQKQKMLHAEQLAADVDLLPLLNGLVKITDVHAEGMQADLYKLPGDSAYNFQFLIDSLKDTTTHDKGKKMKLDINKIKAERVSLKYNDITMSVEDLSYDDNKIDVKKVEATQNDLTLEIKHLTCLPDKGHHLIDFDGLHIKTNNHRPRKNAGKPHRGYFDTGHLDITAKMRLQVDYAQGDSVHGTLLECAAQDAVTGIDLRELRCTVAANKRQIGLSDVVIKQGSTRLSFAHAKLNLPDKSNQRRLTYSTSTITGHTLLRDISRPFAPVLSKFTQPLNLRVRVDGDDQNIRFHDVVVSQPDKKLIIEAAGFVNNLSQKQDLKVHFDVQKMTAKQGEIQHIINFFPVKKFMMKQLNKLGTVHYSGSFDVLWKRELFRGLLQTQAGDLNFDFMLDDLNGYLSGTASTQQLQLGQVMDMKDIGPVSASADFKFDVSKQRTAIMRRQKGGKLPIGQVAAHVTQASYKFVSSNDLEVSIMSDGALAEGTLVAPHKFVDLSCSFSFTDTDNMNGLKVKPSIKFHGAKK